VSTIKVAVIGAGNMGANHIRVLSDIEGVRLAGVCDSNREAVARKLTRYGIGDAYTDVDSLVRGESPDAVVVASPTHTHLAIVTRCLERGLHVFVEKPMASTIAECEQMMTAASRAGRTLFVGHIERWNPVIVKLRENYLGEIYYIETVRSGPFPKRLYGSKDGVVIDLAVHDLDLVAHLLGGLKQIYAHLIRIGSKKQDVYARMMYQTARGALGSSECSWISPRKERRISIYGDKGMLLGNMLDQEVWFHENGDVELDYSDNYFQNILMGRVSEGKVVKFPVRKEEPLRKELEFFLGLVAGTGEGVRFDAGYGRDAVRYSLAVLESAERDSIVRFDKE
jgi:UDP-N-acetylglucosamine 3-dehydrogenase